MKKIRILFYKAAIDGKKIDNLISFWSGLWNWGTKGYSHVELEFCDKRMPNYDLIGICFSSATRGNFTGVRFAPSSEVLKNPKRWDYIEIEIKDETEYAMFNEAKRHIDKKYDYLSILGFCLPWRLNDKGRWFCSEIVNHVLWIGGLLPEPYRWSPRATSKIIEQLHGKLKSISVEKLMGLCEQCNKNLAEIKITFCSRSIPSTILVCNVCKEEIFEQYKRMGKPGQISIIPIRILRKKKQDD